MIESELDAASGEDWEDINEEDQEIEPNKKRDELREQKRWELEGDYEETKVELAPDVKEAMEYLDRTME